jgi:DNA-binding response OmpR family regulator
LQRKIQDLPGLFPAELRLILGSNQTCLMRQPKTLYLIDDDNDDLDFFCEAVSSIDSSIICIRATNSEAALNAFKAHDVPVPDLIFLDLNMPLVDGRQFLSEIKMISPYAHIPIVIYSTSSHSRDIIETRQLGAAGFLTKPYSLSELVVALKVVLDNDLQRISLSPVSQK